MPQNQPDEDPIIIDIDLPVPVYLEALRTAQELGFPSLEASAQHLVDQLVKDAEGPTADLRTQYRHEFGW